MQLYLQSSAYIDWQHPAALAKARELAVGSSDQIEIRPEPLPVVVTVLTSVTTVEEVYRNLPDIELFSSVPGGCNG